ncbi:MAG: protein phosphatase 2C family protein [Clostridia bacterium]|nr:protein phosphatase 2C family protein [Clostridia bacterium]
MKYTVQSGTAINGRGYKPNEDYCIADAENLVFVIADGVTQSVEDYGGGLEKSDAAIAAELTAKALHEALVSAEDVGQGMRDGTRLAIERVAEFNKTSGATFPPASCMISGCIRGDRLHFSYLGDSIAFLLRGDVKIQLAEQQTRYLSLYRKMTGATLTKEEIYRDITNNAVSPGAYGVVLGDMRAMDLLRVSSVRLEAGDRVIISSDGMDQYLFYAPFDEIRKATPEDMIRASSPFDRPPFASAADDKSVILIDVSE